MAHAVHGKGLAHHRRSFPPQRYTDLTKADISLLAPILSPSPVPGTDISAAHEQDTRSLISCLPAHLRSKIPWLTEFCTLHKNLNPLPLISLWNSFKWDVSRELLETWMPLCMEGIVMPAQSHFIDQLLQHSWNTEGNICTACSLSLLIRNNDLLIALGAVVMAMLSLRHRKRSKRLIFLEHFIQGRAPISHADGAVRKMSELGTQLKQLRQRHYRIASGRLRPHADEPAAKYGAGQPQTSTCENNRITTAATTLSNGVMAEDARSRDLSPGRCTPQLRPPPSDITIQKRPVLGILKPNVFEQAFQSSDVETWGMHNFAYEAPSVYSWRNTHSLNVDRPRPSGGARVASLASTIARECEIIDLYSHSQTQESRTNGNHRRAVPEPSLLELRERDVQHTTGYRHNLAPIIIHRNLGGGESPPPTSVLWKRRIAENASRFGAGQIEGPDVPE